MRWEKKKHETKRRDGKRTDEKGSEKKREEKMRRGRGDEIVPPRDTTIVPKLDHFFAAKFYSHFSGNSPNVMDNSIWGVSKTLEKVMKFTRFDVLRLPFIYLDQASRRIPKIMQNDAKIHIKSSPNEHEKIWTSILQCSETQAVAWPAKMHHIVFNFVVIYVALLPPWIQQ